MKTQMGLGRRILVPLTAGLVVLGALWLWCARPGEPEFQGEPASEWILKRFRILIQTGQPTLASTNLLDPMPVSTAIHGLCRIIEKEEPGLVTWYLNSPRALRWLRWAVPIQKYHEARGHRIMAISLLTAYGSNALPGLPVLVAVSTKGHVPKDIGRSLPPAWHASQAIRRLGSVAADAVNPLCAYIESSDPEEYPRMLGVVQAIDPDGRSHAALAKFLQGPNADLAASVLEAMATRPVNYSPEQMFPLVWRLAGHASGKVRRGARTLLGIMPPDSSANPATLQQLSRSSNPAERAAALCVMRQRAVYAIGTLDCVIAGTVDPDMDVALEALTTLHRIMRQEDLEDSDFIRCALAIWRRDQEHARADVLNLAVIYVRHSESARPLLQEALRDESPRLRALAVTESTNWFTSAPTLQPIWDLAVADPSKPVREAATNSLARWMTP
jgi:hypothetical protein